MKTTRLIPLLTAATALNLYAVRTESVSQTSYADFVTGELANVSLDNRGALRASPALEEIAVLDDSNIWTAIADASGVLYIGSGMEGVVYKLDPAAEEPKAEVVFRPDTIMIRALALDKDGNLFVGTSPNGAVYRIAPGGRPELFFNPGEIYIWDMLFDAEGNLFVATGGAARLYKLAPDYQLNTEVEPYFKSDRTHFTRLAWDDNGALIAGSGPKAFLYKITGENAGEVLYSAGTDEIANVMVAGQDIYFTTWHKAGGSDAPPKDLATLLAKFQMKAAGAPSSESSEEEKTSAEGAPSFLLKLDADGFVAPIWSPGGANMQYTTRTEDGAFLVGSDVAGKLYTVHDADTWMLTNQAPREGEVSVILPNVGPEKLTYVFTSNPAAVYRLKADSEEKSVYTAKVVDAGGVARWGKVRPLGMPLADSGLTIKTRSGNAAEPDDTWSDWQALDEGSIASPAARYLEYEVGFGAESRLDGLTVFYGSRNLAPLIGIINVMPVGISLFTADNANPTTLNPKELYSESKTRAALDKEKAPSQKAVVSAETGHISVAWKAFDPNGDTLRYNVAIQAEGEDDWITLADKLTDDAFSTPTRGYADGYYRFRVIGSDAPSNLPAEALTGEMVSQPFLIDNSSPTVSITSQTTDATGAAVLVILAADAWGPIVSANYRIDGQPVVEAIPTDLLYDANDEVFRLTLPDLTPGAHSIVFEARDARGNQGLLKANFTVE